MIAKAGAKSETEIITIFPQTSVLFHMTPMKVSLMFYCLIWTSAQNIVQFLEFYGIFCAYFFNIAVVANNCL